MLDIALQRSCRLYEFIIYTMIVGLLVVVGIIGNSFSFVVFWKGKFNKSTSFLFMCLSLTDTALLITSLVVMSVVPCAIYTGNTQGFENNIYAYIWIHVLPLFLMARTATVWVTVLITVNRYINVCVPLRASQWCTIAKVKIHMVVVILFAILYNIPRYVELHVEHVGTDNGTSFTTLVNVTMHWFDFTYQLMYNTVLYAICIIVLPICILAVLNIRLIKELKALRRMHMQMQTLHSENENSVTFVLVIIVIVLIVCQLPALVTRVLLISAPEEANTCGGYIFYIMPITNMLVVLNSAVNFLVYIMFNNRFRGVLMEKVFKRHATQQVVIFDANAGAAVTIARLGCDELPPRE